MSVAARVVLRWSEFQWYWSRPEWILRY